MSSDPKAGLFEYTAGLDIGNGYVKGVIEDRSADPHDRSANVPVDMVDMPSVAATLIRPNLLQTPDADAPDVLADGQEWFDNADLVFSSNLVPDTYRRVIGRRALATKASSVDAFDLVGNKSKAEQPLSKVLVLGILAAKALRDYVAVTGQLPSPNNPDTVASLTVRAVLALALPISEYEVHRNSYSASFVGTATEPLVHQVRINNFVTPVTVSIVFDNVLVVPEGASAQYAINYFGEPLMERLLADVRSRGVALEGIEATHLLAATDTIGVDVGEGTVNFPVFTGGRFNADASRTLPAGALRRFPRQSCRPRGGVGVPSLGRWVSSLVRGSRRPVRGPVWGAQLRRSSGRPTADDSTGCSRGVDPTGHALLSGRS